MSRYVVIGAGAVGGTIGARLAASGSEVLLVARGAHLEAIQRTGLRLRTPDDDVRVHPQTAAAPAQVVLTDDDVLILATKTHQAGAALAEWADAPVHRDGLPIGPAGEHLPILTALNGVASETMALRYFERVYGVCVWLPAAHLEPGEVIARAAPMVGILHIGRVPEPVGDIEPSSATEQAKGTGPATTGTGHTSDTAGRSGRVVGSGTSAGSDAAFLAGVEADLRRAGLGVQITEGVMAWKYRKLLSNVGNAFQALLGTNEDVRGLAQAARAEARAVLDHAGITYTSDEVEAAARADGFEVREVPGAPQELGGSSWQSLTRGSGTIETDYLNGEIALIARTHGTSAPINTAVAGLAREAARNQHRPGQIDSAALAQALGLA